MCSRRHGTTGDSFRAVSNAKHEAFLVKRFSRQVAVKARLFQLQPTSYEDTTKVNVMTTNSIRVNTPDRINPRMLNQISKASFEIEVYRKSLEFPEPPNILDFALILINVGSHFDVPGNAMGDGANQWPQKFKEPQSPSSIIEGFLSVIAGSDAYERLSNPQQRQSNQPKQDEIQRTGTVMGRCSRWIGHHIQRIL